MYELQIEGMTCGGCANSGRRSIQTVDSNARVGVGLANKKVRIDTQADVNAVKSSIIEAGYPITESDAVRCPPRYTR